MRSDFDKFISRECHRFLAIDLLVFFVFLGLWLSDKVRWPWWVVASPLWLPPVVVVAILAFAILLLVVLMFLTWMIEAILGRFD